MKIDRLNVLNAARALLRIKRQTWSLLAFPEGKDLQNADLSELFRSRQR